MIILIGKQVSERQKTGLTRPITIESMLIQARYCNKERETRGVYDEGNESERDKKAKKK